MAESISLQSDSLDGAERSHPSGASTDWTQRPSHTDRALECDGVERRAAAGVLSIRLSIIGIPVDLETRPDKSIDEPDYDAGPNDDASGSFGRERSAVESANAVTRFLFSECSGRQRPTHVAAGHCRDHADF